MGVSVTYLVILTIIYVSYSFQFDRQTLSIALRFLRAKTPEQRAAVDLDTHYSQVKTPLISGFIICLFCFKCRMQLLTENSSKIYVSVMQEYLAEYIGLKTRRAILYQVRVFTFKKYELETRILILYTFP